MRALPGIVCAALLCGAAAAEDPDAAAKAMVQRYVATWDTQALLDEPAVQGELRELAGPAFDKLLHNLDVNAGIEYYGSALTVRGNAPHHGLEEEAVLCVQPYGTLRVHAAVLSAGRITVYTRESRYQFLPTCMKDWITLVNAGHAGRFSQPANVRLQDIAASSARTPCASARRSPADIATVEFQ